MKRLKYYFKLMERDTATYNYRGEDNKQHSLYDGDMLLFYPEHDDPTDDREPETVRDSTYYDDSHAYTVELSNKMAKDKPTVTVAVPTDEIDPRLLDLWKSAGIDAPGTVKTSDTAPDYIRQEEETRCLLEYRREEQEYFLYLVTANPPESRVSAVLLMIHRSDVQEQ
jgi:hypothetical protein